MKQKLIFIMAALLLTGMSAGAQTFKARQKKQEKVIRSAYKRHLVTLREYEKLLDEQDKIKESIAKGDAYGWTPHESKSTEGKLDRAANRIKRYEEKGAVY